MTKSNSVRLFIAMFLVCGLCLTVVGTTFASAAFLPTKNLASKKIVSSLSKAVPTAQPTTDKPPLIINAVPGDSRVPEGISDSYKGTRPLRIPDPADFYDESTCGALHHVKIMAFNGSEGVDALPDTLRAGERYFWLAVYGFDEKNRSCGPVNASWKIVNESGSAEINFDSINYSTSLFSRKTVEVAWLKAIRTGRVSVTATVTVLDGTFSRHKFTDSYAFSVVPGPAYRIELTTTPNPAIQFVGDAVELTATVYDYFGNLVNTRVYFDSTNFTFSENNRSFYDAPANGSLTAHLVSTAPGSAVVTAGFARPSSGRRGIICDPTDTPFELNCHLDFGVDVTPHFPGTVVDSNYSPVYSANVTITFVNRVASLVLDANPDSIEADGSSNSTITATLLAPDGSPAYGFVNFSTTAGTLSSSHVVASSGTASVNLTSSREIEDATVTAVAYAPIENSTPVTAQIIVPFTAGPPASLDLNLSTHDAFQGDPVDVHITVQDSRGRPVSNGTTVEFCATPEDGTPSCTNHSTTNGRVDFTFTWPDPARVDVNATAGTASDSDSIVFRVLPPAYLLLDAVSPTTIGQQSLLTATLLNRNHLPVPDGAIIEFNILTGNGLLSAPAATTAGGVAQVNLTSNESGYVTVGASWNSTLHNTTQVLFVGEPARITLSASDYAPQAGQAIVLTANVSDENGYPAAEGTIVDFVAPAEVLFTTSSAPTVDGIAQTSASSNVAGTYVITALVGSLQANVTKTVSPAAPAQVIIAPANVTLRAGEGQQFNAVVYDAYGNIVSTPVSWSTGALGSINASGYFTALRAGNESVTASAGAVSNSTSVTIRPGVLASLEVTAAPTSIQVGGATSTLTITGRDFNGDLVDEPLSVSLDSSLGTLSDTEVTLAGGTATATLASGTVVGNATVAAVSGPIVGTTTVEFVHGPAAVITANALPSLVSPNGASIITARVTDAFGNPIQGVLVLFEIIASPSPASLSAPNASTDSLGIAVTALTTGSAEGFYNVSCTVNGTSLSANASVEVQRGIGTIAGYVKNYYGAPVANATVEVNGTNATTLSDGYYAVSMRAGTYNATATAQYHVPQTLAGIVVSEGMTTQANFTLLEYGTLSGTVRDSYGNLLDGATISAGTESTASVLGSYSLRLAPGTYDVTASLAGHYPQTVFGVAIETGNTSTANFTLVSVVGILRGTVRDQLGTPIVGALVTLEGTGRTDTTDSSGGYEFADVAPGDYEVTASAAGYYSSGTTARVLPGEVTVADITLYQETLLRGRVTDSAGTPIAGAFVSVDSTHNDTTDASGYYEITGLTPGSYTVTASASGYLTASESALLAPGTNELNFSLVQTGSINGTVRFLFGGAPVAGALVRATQDGRLIAFTDTLADGSYALNGLEQGYYNVTVSGAGFSEQTQLAYVVAGRTTTLTFRVY